MVKLVMRGCEPHPLKKFLNPPTSMPSVCQFVTCPSFHDVNSDVREILLKGITTVLVRLFGWLFWRFYVALAVFQPYRDLEAGDINQSIKSLWRDRELNAGPLAPQANYTTAAPFPCLLLCI